MLPCRPKSPTKQNKQNKKACEAMRLHTFLIRNNFTFTST